MNRDFCNSNVVRTCTFVLSCALALTFAATSSATVLVDMNFNGPTGLENPGLGPDGVLLDGATIVGGELRTNGSNAAAGSGLDLPLGKQLAYVFSGAADFHLSFDFATLSGGEGTLFNADGSKYLYDTIPGFNPDLAEPTGGGQAGSLAIYCQAAGIKVDLWFLGTMTLGGVFNDNQMHNLALDYDAHEGLMTLRMNNSDDLVSTLDVAAINDGGFFRDTSHDLIRVGDINNPDSELGEQGTVHPIAARFDNLLIDGSPEPPVKLIVNRANGSMTIEALSTTPVPINSISILSEAGTLVPANYQEIDAKNPTFDPNDTWAVTAQSPTAITNSDTPSGANDGATLAAGQTFDIDNGITGIWKKFFDEDLKISVFDLGFNTDILGSVEYIGEPVKFADLNFDGNVDLTDYQLFQDGFDDSIAGLSYYDAYFHSDLNGDATRDYEDFIAFAEAFDLDNGEGAFALMTSGIPEPASALLFALGAVGLLVVRTRTRLTTPAPLAILFVAASLTLSSTANAAKLVEYLFTTNLSDTSGNNRNGTNVTGFFGAVPTVSGGKLHLSGDIGESVNVPMGAGVNNVNPFGGTSDYRIEMKITSSGSTLDPNLGLVLFSSSPFNSDPENDDIQSLSVYVEPDSRGGSLVVDYWFAGEVRLPSAGLLDGAEHSITVSYVAPDTPTGPGGAPNAGSMYLNVDGNWKAAGDITARPPNIAAQSVRIGSSRNSVFPFQDDVDGELTQINTDFEGAIDDFRIYNDAIEPTQLRAEVDAATGEVKLLGGQLWRTLKYYQLTSASGSLNPVGWLSLEDQGLDQIGTGIGQHWDEAVASPTQMAESFLLGSSLFDPTTDISLGNIFKIGQTRDLQFIGVTDDLDDIGVDVTYINVPAIPQGDYNQNGVVDAADYTLWRNTFGQALPNGTGADGDGNGFVQQADYTYWKTRFGNTSGSGAGSLSQVPEPATWLISMVTLATPAGFVAGRSRRPQSYLADQATK